MKRASLTLLCLCFASLAHAQSVAPVLTPVPAPTPAPAAAVADDESCAARLSREDGSTLSSPVGVHLADSAQDAPSEDGEIETPWSGPRVDLGYVLYSLPDGWSGGLVHAASISGYVPTRKFRLGAYVDGGVRDYSLGGNDAVVRVTAFAGYQHLSGSWFVPFIVGTATGGVLLGKRFSTTFTDFMGGLGAEAGFEINPVKSLHFGLAFGGMWLMMDDLHYGTWQLRIFIGL